MHGRCLLQSDTCRKHSLKSQMLNLLERYKNLSCNPKAQNAKFQLPICPRCVWRQNLSLASFSRRIRKHSWCWGPHCAQICQLCPAHSSSWSQAWALEFSHSQQCFIHTPLENSHPVILRNRHRRVWKRKENNPDCWSTWRACVGRR